jgi:hypothetical protein
LIDTIPLSHKSELVPTFGKISFVDLAGSERAKMSGQYLKICTINRLDDIHENLLFISTLGSSGMTLKEAGHINKSLYVLGMLLVTSLCN